MGFVVVLVGTLEVDKAVDIAVDTPTNLYQTLCHSLYPILCRNLYLVLCPIPF
jgi:hypothetical protein